MQFFKDFNTFQALNESLDRKETVRKLNKSTAEIRKDKDNANVEMVLRKVDKVLHKSNEEVLKDKSIKDAIAQIYGYLNDNITSEDKKNKMKEDSRYKHLQNFVTELEKEDAEIVKKVLAQYEEAVKSGEIKEEPKEEAKKEETKEEPKKEEVKTEKEADPDKIKSLFAGTKVTAKSAPVLSKTLSKQEMPEVKALQQFLTDKGFLAVTEASAADGYFGEKTAAAVKAYQKSKNITVDGIVGTNTWKEIFKDVKFDTAKEFKAVQLNQPVQKTGDKKADKEADTKATAEAEKSLNKIKIDYNDALPTKLSVDRLVELLTSEQMSSSTHNSDEDKIVRLIVGQVLNGAINKANAGELLTKYKTEANSDLIKDLISTFDTITLSINNQLNLILKNKKAPEDQYKNILKIEKSLPGADAKHATIIFLALASTGNKDILTALTQAGIDVKIIEQINA